MESKTETDYTLLQYQELRFSAQEDVIIVLLDGNAELYGMRMILLKEYELKNGTICTWYGNKTLIRIVGKLDFAYVINNKNYMIQLANVAAAIDFFVRKVEQHNNDNKNINLKKQGPKILITGNLISFSICQTLANYMSRNEHPFVVCDLNTKNNQITNMPNSIGAFLCNEPFCSFLQQQDQQQLVYFLGNNIVSNFYLHICNKLKINMESKPKSNGWIINVNNSNYINEIVNVYNPDLIIVVNDDKLQYDLHVLFASKISIVKLTAPTTYSKMDKCKKKIITYFDNNIEKPRVLTNVCAKQIFDQTTSQSVLPLGTSSLLTEKYRVEDIPINFVASLCGLHDINDHIDDPVIGFGKISTKGLLETPIKHKNIMIHI